MWFVVFLLCLIVFFFYDRKKHNYWKNLGVPSPKSDFLFGTIKNTVLGKQCLGLRYADIYTSFTNSKFVGVYELYKPRLLIIDPELANKVLVSDFAYFTDRISKSQNQSTRLSQHLTALTGRKWKAVRTKLTHTFSSIKLKLMYDLIQRCATLLESNIKEYASASDPIDIKEVMAKFTTDVIGACAFGMDFNSLTNRESLVWKISQKLSEKSPRGTIVGLLRIFCQPLVELLKLSEFPPEIEQFFFDLLQQTEKFRKNETNRRKDFLQHMLDIRDQELSDYKEKGEKTLRKYNPAFLSVRVCVKDYPIPGTTVVLKPGTSVIIPIHGFHHDERYFPDPEKFDPERFSEQNAHKINPCTYLPFGNGPRICIGLRFAKLEAKACLSTLLMKYKFNTCDKKEKCIQVHPRSVLNSPAKPIYLQVTEI